MRFSTFKKKNHRTDINTVPRASSAKISFVVVNETNEGDSGLFELLPTLVADKG
jgi:hypothetical protein